jgi:hypothetical protein
MTPRRADRDPAPATARAGWRAIGFLAGGGLLMVFGIPFVTFGSSEMAFRLSLVPPFVGVLLILVAIGYFMIWLVRRAPPMG